MFFRGLIIFVSFFVVVLSSHAIDKGLQIFRVGTGPSISNSYLTGITLASSISKPAGSISCEQSGLCGVPGLIAMTQTQNGFIDSIVALDRGEVESVLVPANIAYWAYSGSGEFENFRSYSDIRVFASIKPELMHLIVRVDSGIESVSDLRGRGVYLGWRRSGNLYLVSRILELHGLSMGDVDSYDSDPNEALDALASGDIEAAFFMESTGADSIAQLFEGGDFRLLSLDTNDLLRLRSEPFVNLGVIPQGSYGDLGEILTVGVDLLWLTRSDTSVDLVGKIVRALWNSEASAESLKLGAVDSADSLDWVRDSVSSEAIDGVPLHVGALRYFETLLRLHGGDVGGGEG